MGYGCRMLLRYWPGDYKERTSRQRSMGAAAQAVPIFLWRLRSKLGTVPGLTGGCPRCLRALQRVSHEMVPVPQRASELHVEFLENWGVSLIFIDATPMPSSGLVIESHAFYRLLQFYKQQISL